MSEDANRADLPPADRFTVLWRRLKDHRIAQWTVGYVAVAYGIQHAVTLTSEAFKWPDAVLRISMLLLALGLPVAMTLAWYHGERVSRRISGGEMAVVSVMLVGISFAFYLFVRPAESSLRTAEVNITTSSNSLAVLPLANVSGDKDQEFFSDGMTDEIALALAKVPALRVVGRESAFEFKGKNQNDRAIGKALGARYLVEGSVRKAGDRVRITAELARADTGVSLWTEGYDRELKDVFAVQEDVARAIAASLQVPLGLKQGESLVSNRAVDPESYQNYLRAKALIRSRGAGTPLTAPIALLEQVTTREPAYTPAWALLAQAYSLEPTYDGVYRQGSVEQLRRVSDAALTKAEAAARRAISLDPHSADGYVGLGSTQFNSTELLDAEGSFKEALALEPLNPDVLHWYSMFIAATGRLREALAMREQLRSLEPLVPVFNGITGRLLWADGQNDAALAIAMVLPSNRTRALDLATIYASTGRYNEAAAALLSSPTAAAAPGATDIASRLLRAARGPAPHQGIPYLADMSFVFLYVGLPERALEFNEHNADADRDSPPSITALWHPDYRPVRTTERFKALVRKLGLVDYWRARGWPEFCHPTTGDDFACN